MWRSFNWITGFQIRTVVKTAKESVDLGLEANYDNVKKIARSLYYALCLKHKTFKFLNEYVILIFLKFIFRQIYVTWLYLAMKFSYVILICIHLAIFKHFIGNFEFAFGVLNQKEWQATGHFPRVTVCDFSVCFIDNLNLLNFIDISNGSNIKLYS